MSVNKGPITAESFLDSLNRETSLHVCDRNADGVRDKIKSQNAPVRGKPKSGRIWKTPRESRHSAFTLDKQLKSSWTKKMQLRAEKKSVKAYEKELKERKAKELEERKRRQVENKKKKEERQRKAEVVQKIKNTAKIKKMKKSQLRMIEKR